MYAQRRLFAVRHRLALLAVVLAAVSPALAAAPHVTARAYVVENGATGDVLLASHARERVPIASITKLMTVLVALEHVPLEELVTVSYDAAAIGESTVGLRPGEQLTVLDLIKAVLIQSANDAAYALAEHVGGGDVDAFVAMMNEEASVLRLRDTHFERPDGLDTPGHYSTAHDVTALARVVMRIPVVRRTVRMKTDTIAGGRVLYNWNDLLGSFPGVIGVKTGHTSLAGWSEVAAARGSEVTVYATLLGSPSRDRRNADLARLLRYGISRYRTVAVIQRSRVYAWARAPYGIAPLALVVPRRAVRVVRVDRPLLERVVAADVVALPVVKGQRLGEVFVYDRRRLIARAPLLASRSIVAPDLGGRVLWYAERTAHHIWSWVS